MTDTDGVQVAIEADAADWIRRHGGAVTLRQSPRHGCCGSTAMLPVAEARTPASLEAWIVRNVDGVSVYIDPQLDAQAGPLTIHTEGFRQWRRLFVETTGAKT